MGRHRWHPISISPIPYVYKASECEKCKCVRLHKYIGGTYTKTYLSKGKELDVKPDCNE